jgi:hypothetical protein
MSKHQAKEVLALCMPVHESVLAHHVRTVSSMALRVAHKRQERMQVRDQLAPMLYCRLCLGTSAFQLS